MNKKGISLIVLIIIIIVILILASAVTLGLLKNSPITNANQAKFKQDIAKFQEDLDVYLNDLSIQTSGIFEREYFSATKSSMTYTGEGNVSTAGKNIYNIFGNIKDTEYEDYLYVENGEMAYDESKLNDFQKIWIKEILGVNLVAEEYILDTESYVGYYADIDGDGTVDGVIYADLAIGNTGDGEYGGSTGTYTIPQMADTKKYYIVKKAHSDDFGTKDVLTAKGDGNERFYVMALDDISTNEYCWYDAAYGNMSDYNTATSVDFGKGKQNTEKMIGYWNNEKYGVQDDSETYKDMLGAIQGEAAKGWYVPSRAEWAAFGGELGITSSNYGSFGLSSYYWSSSQTTPYTSWAVVLNSVGMSTIPVSNLRYVRLGSTF